MEILHFLVELGMGERRVDIKFLVGWRETITYRLILSVGKRWQSGTVLNGR